MTYTPELAKARKLLLRVVAHGLKDRDLDREIRRFIDDTDLGKGWSCEFSPAARNRSWVAEDRERLLDERVD